MAPRLPHVGVIGRAQNFAASIGGSPGKTMGELLTFLARACINIALENESLSS